MKLADSEITGRQLIKRRAIFTCTVGIPENVTSEIAFVERVVLARDVQRREKAYCLVTRLSV
jgi:hypothetical protein